MISRLLKLFNHNLLLRVTLTSIVVMAPVSLTTTRLGAEYQATLWNLPTSEIFGKLLTYGVPASAISGVFLIYAIERWLIQDRAVHAFKWIALRFLSYMGSGFLVGLATRTAVRFGVAAYPPTTPVIESVYFLQTMLNLGTVALVFTFLERGVQQVREREASLKQQIKALRIKIDQTKKEQELAAVVESEYFQDLQSKAKQQRRKKAEDDKRE